MDEKEKKPIKKKSPVAQAKEATAKKRAAKAAKKPAAKTASGAKKPAVKKVTGSKLIMTTNMGVIELELAPDKAPITVANFIEYVKSGHFDGLIFHRVIPNFMIQGGGMDADMQEKKNRAPIKIESDNGLSNVRGTIAMARTNDPNSATSQFFINLIDNHFLDFKAPSAQGYGYAVFGHVAKGMDVVDKIASIPTGQNGYYSDVPSQTVIIENVKVK